MVVLQQPAVAARHPIHIILMGVHLLQAQLYYYAIGFYVWLQTLAILLVLPGGLALT